MRTYKKLNKEYINEEETGTEENGIEGNGELGGDDNDLPSSNYNQENETLTIPGLGYDPETQTGNTNGNGDY